MLRDLRVLIAMQLTEAADATSAEQVCDIMPPVPGLSSGDGLYAGIDGDGRLEGALHAEGWSYRWAYTTHYWCMEAPDGSALTFIEGDLYIGDQQAPQSTGLPSATPRRTKRQARPIPRPAPPRRSPLRTSPARLPASCPRPRPPSLLPKPPPSRRPLNGHRIAARADPTGRDGRIEVTK